MQLVENNQQLEEEAMEIVLQQTQPPNLHVLQQQLQREHKRQQQEWIKLCETEERVQVTLVLMQVERETVKKDGERIVEVIRRLKELHLVSPVNKK